MPRAFLPWRQRPRSPRNRPPSRREARRHDMSVAAAGSMSAGIEPRPQLILLPGLLCDADLWRDQIAGLSDLANCHVADLTRGETLSKLAETVLAEAAPTFALAGFSLGGYAAQEITRQAPDRIERLALIDTSIRPDSPERTGARRSRMWA